MSYFESYYQAEEIMCDKIRKAIAEYLSVDKKFIPFFNGETIVKIEDIYSKIPLSRALSDLLDFVASEYRKFRGE